MGGGGAGGCKDAYEKNEMAKKKELKDSSNLRGKESKEGRRKEGELLRSENVQSPGS